MDLQLAKGVRDIAPEEKIIKNKVIASLQTIFELYGFMPFETPIIERYETLTAKGGAEEGSDCLKETFQLMDQGQRKLGLRFELTTSLARFMALNPNVKLPFKRYELGPVFRDGPIKLGRYREFWQCDVDTIGSSSMLAEAEFLALTAAFFAEWKLPIIIKVNNRKLLNGILEQAGITKLKEAIIAIDKLDKIGVKGVSVELAQRGYTQQQIGALFDLLEPGVRLATLIPTITSVEGKQGLLELQELLKYVEKLDVDVVFDVSLARGQAYYTGTVFEAYLRNPQESEPKGSLAGGGRYDDMVGKFMGGGRLVPAVGISFGLEPIMDVLKARSKVSCKTMVRALVLPINTPRESFEIVQMMRSKGISCDLALGKKGVSKNLEYAASLGIPYVIIVGEDELKQKKVKLRDMESGEEKLFTVSEAMRELR